MYMNFQKGIKLDFVCMKIKLMKNNKYLQQKCSCKVLVQKPTTDFTSRVGKSYVPFTCKFPMIMYFVLDLHKCCGSKTNSFYSKTKLV